MFVGPENGAKRYCVRFRETIDVKGKRLILRETYVAEGKLAICFRVGFSHSFMPDNVDDHRVAGVIIASIPAPPATSVHHIVMRLFGLAFRFFPTRQTFKI